MPLKLRERFGLPFMFLLIAAACWYYVTHDLMNNVYLRELSPLAWLSIVPYGDWPLMFINTLPQPWPLWIVGVILFVVWALIFMVMRGGYYSFRYAGDLSMWQLFGFCIVFGIVMFFVLLIPVMNQIEIWKASW